MWHEGTIDGYWWQAKVYDEGSQFGINGGRVSKLAICEGDRWDHNRVIYHYDRGLDFSKCPPGVLEKVLEQANQSMKATLGPGADK